MKLQFIRKELLQTATDLPVEFNLLTKAEAKTNGLDYVIKRNDFIRDLYRSVKIKFFLANNEVYETDLDDFWPNITGDLDAFMIRGSVFHSCKFLFSSAITAFEVIGIDEEKEALMWEIAKELKITQQIP